MISITSESGHVKKNLRALLAFCGNCVDFETLIFFILVFLN